MTMMGRNDFAKTYSSMKSRKKKTKGIIYVEDETDKSFWEKIATDHVVQLYSEQNRVFTGKSKLLQICSPNQLIGIDSDFDNLCPKNYSAKILFSQKANYILETYAHSRENIEFSPECLCQILDEKFKFSKNTILDEELNSIISILNKLSEIWFEPYKKFLYLLDNKKYKHKRWMMEIEFKGTETQDIVFKNDFSSYENRLSLLNDSLNKIIDNKNDFEKFCQELAQKDFKENNVWAFIRGHDFEKKFVMKIMAMIYKKRIQSESNDIRMKYSNNLEQHGGINKVMRDYFYDVYFDQVEQNDFFVKKIIDKYQSILAMA